MNQLIVISAKGVNPVYRERFKVTQANNLKINFIEYVKSQLHNNVVTDFFNRNIFAYLNAYKFLKGEIFLEDEALKVMHYFYKDIANFLIKNPADMNVYITINSDEDSGQNDLRFMLGNIEECSDFSQVLSHIQRS